MRKLFWVKLFHTLVFFGSFIANAFPEDGCFIFFYEPEMPSALNKSDK